MADHEPSPDEPRVLLHELRHQTPWLARSPDATSMPPRELAIVLDQYDLGAITSIRPLARGSAMAPKVVVETPHGRFLLKRRAPGMDDPSRVALSHAAMLELGDRGFPVPALVGTRDTNNSMLQLGGRVYELVAFVEGDGFDATPRAAAQAGATLGRLHNLLAAMHLPFEAPAGSYHHAELVEDRLARAQDQLGLAARGEIERIERAYRQAGERAEDAGLAGAARQLVHGDWHPGNLIYHAQAIAAVVDFDALCIAQPACDLANGALQCSLLAPAHGSHASDWPIGLDLDRFGAFVTGYAAHRPITSMESRALPWLMIEALIAEATGPLAATGRFGPIEGRAFLGIITQQIAWLVGHADAITQAAMESFSGPAEPQSGSNRADGIDPAP